jgi:hypothetical protein
MCDELISACSRNGEVLSHLACVNQQWLRRSDHDSTTGNPEPVRWWLSAIQNDKDCPDVLRNAPSERRNTHSGTCNGFTGQLLDAGAAGRGAGVGRGRGVGTDLGVGVGLGVAVGVSVAVGVAVAVGVGVAVAVAVAVGLGVGPPDGDTRT